ncbi:MAG: hypothetical protein ACR2N7_12935 [Acidimicrobiia bacterium]
MQSRLTRRMAWLFAIGATLFALGAFPPYFEHFGDKVAACTFFIGSLFFTSAAYTQYYITINHDVGERRFLRSEVLDRSFVAASVQLVGTLAFNVSTLAAVDQAFTASDLTRLIWAPDAFGSVAFLVSSVVALTVARHLNPMKRWAAVANVAGSVAFGMSALAAYVVPTTGEVVNIRAVNVGTFIGGIFFLVGALLTLLDADKDDPEPSGAKSVDH